MENASKALLMAAGILIGILLLSLAVYLFASFGKTSAELHKQKAEAVLEQFNTKFTSYENRNDVTIHDVVTAANLATETNVYYDYKFSEHNGSDNGKDSYIYVILKNNNIAGYSAGKRIEGGIDNTTNYENLLVEALENDTIVDNGLTRLRRYTCKTERSQYTGRVWKVTFTVAE